MLSPQSFILSFVFYGWGLGQFGHMSAANGILLAIAIYAARRSRARCGYAASAWSA